MHNEQERHFCSKKVHGDTKNRQGDVKRKRQIYASKHVLISLFDCHCPFGSCILVPDLPCVWCTSSCGRARGSGHLYQLWRLLHVLWGGDLLLREQHTMLVTLRPCRHAPFRKISNSAHCSRFALIVWRLVKGSFFCVSRSDCSLTI